MEYVIADIKKAQDWGFSEIGHKVSNSIIYLNEKEIMNSQSLKGSLTERADQLEGRVVSVTEAKLIMNNSNSQ